MILDIKRIKVNKNQKDYIYTFVTEFIVLCLSILVYKFSAIVLGENGFSVYALTRRTVSFIQPIVMIGIGVALPRYIAFTMNNKKENNLYLISSFLLFFIVSFLLLTILIVFRQTFSGLFFESPGYSNLIAPLVLYIFSLGFHSIVYGYYRGELLMLKANILQLINIGFIPVLSFILFKNLLSILLFSSAGVFLISLIFIYPEIDFKDINYRVLQPFAKTVFNYGIRRISGDVTLAAYFTIPAYIVTHKAGIIIGGYVAFAITFINLFGTAFTPVSLILLPKASIIIRNKDFKMLKTIFRKFVILSVGLSLIGIVLIEIFIPEIVNIYLGKNYIHSVPVIRIIILGCMGYTVFIALRSIIDAYYHKAINTRNIIISFLVMISSLPAIYLFNTNNYLIIYFFAISVNLLGLLTFFNVRKIIKINS